MDEPLFGEQRRTHKIANYVCAGLVSVFVVETVIAALVMSGKDYRNILLATLVVLQATVLTVLLYWYRQGDLDPKFIYLNVFLGFLVILMCTVSQFYIFTNFPGYECYSQNPPAMYYDPNKVCLPYCQGQGMCLVMSTMSCANCSALTIAANMAKTHGLVAADVLANL